MIVGNDIGLDAPQEGAAGIVFGLAAAMIAEDGLAGWIVPLLAPGLSLNASI